MTGATVADRTLQYARAYSDTGGERAWRDEPAGSPIPFVASTPGVKRDGLDLRASGWKTDRFRMNPAVLWCHDHKLPPIGNATTEILTNRLRMPVTFDQEDPFAVTIESKVRRGVIRGCSVGWDWVDEDGQPLHERRLTVDYLRDNAFYDLTELSIVPVGSDPDALTERRRTGLRALGRELVALYDEQEHPDADSTGSELRAAVRAELARLGLDPDGLPAAGTVLEAGPIVAQVDEAALGRAIAAAFGNILAARADEPDAPVTEPGPDQPDEDTTGNAGTEEEDSAARAAAIDPTAARDVLAAFNLTGSSK
jgi:hypothetical protein